MVRNVGTEPKQFSSSGFKQLNTVSVLLPRCISQMLKRTCEVASSIGSAEVSVVSRALKGLHASTHKRCKPIRYEKIQINR